MRGLDDDLAFLREYFAEIRRELVEQLARDDISGCTL
jgi:hypothetical protein